MDGLARSGASAAPARTGSRRYLDLRPPKGQGRGEPRRWPKGTALPVGSGAPSGLCPRPDTGRHSSRLPAPGEHPSAFRSRWGRGLMLSARAGPGGAQPSTCPAIPGELYLPGPARTSEPLALRLGRWPGQSAGRLARGCTSELRQKRKQGLGQDALQRARCRERHSQRRQCAGRLCMCTHVSVCVYAHACAYLQCTRLVHVSVCAYSVSMYTHVSVHLRVCVCLCVSLSIRVHMCTHG